MDGKGTDRVRLDEGPQRGADLDVPVEGALGELVGDLAGRITRPTLDRVQGNDPDRMSIGTIDGE